jgi:hypothetical protein
MRLWRRRPLSATILSSGGGHRHRVWHLLTMVLRALRRREGVASQSRSKQQQQQQLDNLRRQKTTGPRVRPPQYFGATFRIQSGYAAPPDRSATLTSVRPVPRTTTLSRVVFYRWNFSERERISESSREKAYRWHDHLDIMRAHMQGSISRGSLQSTVTARSYLTSTTAVHQSVLVLVLRGRRLQLGSEWGDHLTRSPTDRMLTSLSSTRSRGTRRTILSAARNERHAAWPRTKTR